MASFFMFIVYILYSPSSGKSYTGFTSDIERRLQEHNITESKGFTLRYRPWTLIHTEPFDTKPMAMEREKFYKTGKGREVMQQLVAKHIAETGLM